jgi:DNA helicase HerA-like ATPase
VPLSQLPADVSTLDTLVTEVPSVAEDAEHTVAAARDRVIPAVAMAHATGDRLVGAWLRPPGSARVAILCNGAGVGARPLAHGVLELALPPGARGGAIANGRVATMLDGLHWARCEGRFDALTTGERNTDPPLERGFEDYFATLPGVLGRLVGAAPRTPADVAAHIERLSTRIGMLQAHEHGLGSERLQLQRAEAELQQLEAWMALGLWDVTVWVGADSPPRARAAVALLSASADLAALSVRLRPEGGLPADDVWSPSFLATAEVVAALTRPPVRELPGVRVIDPPDFDVTPEGRGRVVLGGVLDARLRPCARFGVGHDTLNRHAFVAGATGSGKSQTIRRLLEQLAGEDGADEVPWLVVEPAKAEYRRMAGRLAGRRRQVTVIRPGDRQQPPASLNPLEPTSVLVDSPPGRVTFPLQTHLDLVRALFVAAFEATEPFPQVLASALARCYEDLGWDLALARSLGAAEGVLPSYPTLADLQRTALAVVDGVGYGQEVRDNVRGFVDVRIGSLRLGTPGRFFEAGHPLDLEALIERNVVFELEDIGDDKDKAFLIGTVVIRLFELFRLKFADAPQRLRHVMVLEEAHRLLRATEPGSPVGHAVEIFANLLAEIRAYGVGIVVAEQIPAKIITDVVKNSALKIMHRLPAADDREFVGATMNLNEQQSRYVVTLPPGRGVVHADGMDRPILVDVETSDADVELEADAYAAPPISCPTPACPSRCATEPCRLDELVTSAKLAEDPELVLLGELTVVAHLLGEPFGIPKLSWVQELRARIGGLGPGRLRCALGQVVDRAVRSRSPQVQRFYDPDELVRVAADELVELLRQPRSGPPWRAPEPQWQVGAFRWHDVVRSLRAPPGPGERVEEPHPLTQRWRARGLVLNGRTWAEQLTEADTAALRVRTPHRATFLGDPPAIEAAAARRSRAETPARRLEEAIAFMEFPSTWPAFRLYLQPAKATGR